MKFGIPIIWIEPSDHLTNCYFCIVDPSKRRSGKNALSIVYVDIPSFIAPVAHNAELVVPIPPGLYQCSHNSKSESDTNIVK